VKLLVLGGTKFLGRAAVDAALARGHEVTLFNRGETNPELHPQAEKLRGDREHDLSALEQAAAVRKQMPRVPASHILAEPIGRNTAAARPWRPARTNTATIPTTTTMMTIGIPTDSASILSLLVFLRLASTRREAFTLLPHRTPSL